MQNNTYNFGKLLCLIYMLACILSMQYNRNDVIYTNSLLLLSAHTFQDVENIAAILDIVGEIASSSNIGATDVTAHLERITNNLRTGMVRSGIVGLTKSGKSTTLNALLGKSFLPSSIQPQTAKEVKIIHSPATPEGELYAVEKKGDQPVFMVSGKEEINKYLTEVNTNKRENRSTYDKIVLHAPFLFLHETEQVKLEVSDTPGLFEAAAKGITKESEIALKEMCAFVLVMKLGLLKTVSESKLLHRLTEFHPDLLAKRNRVLILVNALDVVYFDDSPSNLKPAEIPEYISKYLANPTILGIRIPPAHIIPFSAKWALKPRVWSANPAAFIDSKGSEESYAEALILLEKAGYQSEVEPLREMNEENVRIVSSLLIKFSQIETIEEKLREMLYRNGPDVLLEATVDDTLAEIENLGGIITTKIEEQGLDKKHGQVMKCKQLLDAVLKMKGAQIQSVRQIPTYIHESVTPQINTMVDSLKKAIDGHIGTTLMGHLKGFDNKDNRNEVYSRICSVKSIIGDPAQRQRESSWSSISGVVRSAQLQHVKNFLAQLKIKVGETFQTDGMTGFPGLQTQASELSSHALKVIDQLDPNSLIPAFPSLNQGINAGTIPDAKLNYIIQTSVTRWRTEYRSKKKKSGFLGLGRKRVKWTESVPYEVKVHSPDISGLKSAFSTEGSSQWVQIFRRRVDEVVAQTSQALVNEANKILTNALSQSENTVQQTLAEVEGKEQKSKTVVEDLRQRVEQINEAKTNLLDLQ